MVEGQEGRTGRMGSNYSISSKGRRERGGDGGFYSLSISGIKEDLRHDGRKGREDHSHKPHIISPFFAAIQKMGVEAYSEKKEGEAETTEGGGNMKGICGF